MTQMLRPAAEWELQSMIAKLVTNRQTAEVVGNGALRNAGRAVDADVVVTTASLRGLTLYEPTELVMSARSGTPLADIEAELGLRDQMLPFEPIDMGPTTGSPGGALSIGGVFATNASGARRITGGSARDHLLGLRAVNGRAELFKSGGRVMKNVTGYDLVKLLAGSRGTLGVLTEVSFKVQALPEAEATLVIGGLGDEAGLAALRQALGSPFDISGAARHSGQSLIRVEGMAGSVAYRLDRLRALVGGDVEVAEAAVSAALWRDVRDVALFHDKPGEVWRIVTLPTAAAEIAGRLAGEALWDCGGGLIWLRLDHGRGAEVAAAVAGRGHATRVRGDGGPVFPPEAPEVALLAAGLRAKFDPRGILNAGLMG